MTVPNHILDKFPKLSSEHLLKNLNLPVGKNKIIYTQLLLNNLKKHNVELTKDNIYKYLFRNKTRRSIQKASAKAVLNNLLNFVK